MGIWNRRRKRELVGTRESGRRKGMRVGATSVCQRSVGMWEAGDAATLEATRRARSGFKKDSCLYRRFLSLENGKKVW
jgi:hypothetical protein